MKEHVEIENPSSIYFVPCLTVVSFLHLYLYSSMMQLYVFGNVIPSSSLSNS